MADLSQHQSYTGNWSGLLDNFYVTAVVAAICLVGYEIEVHIPRRRGKDGTYQRIVVRLYHAGRRGWRRWKGGDKEARGSRDRKSVEEVVRGREATDLVEARKLLGDRERWEFGYIYQPKAWALNAGPPVPRWPLAWVWSSLSVKEKHMTEKCGLDITLHMRFLRGSFFYTLMQMFIILPVLLPLHIIYSSSTISETSMLRAGVSSLVDSGQSRWLWVHAILIWWVSITWTATVLWITWGGLAYRRREIQRLAERVQADRKRNAELEGNEEAISEADRWSVKDDCEGIKRFRTLMVTNIPPDMRDEDTLRDYFDYYIHRHRLRRNGSPETLKAIKAEAASKIPQIIAPVIHPGKILKNRSESKANTPVVLTLDSGSDNGDGEEGEGCEVNMEDDDDFETEVDEIVLVRKLGSIASLRDRRTKVLKQLELAHVQLAKRVLKAVAAHQKRSQSPATREDLETPAHDKEKGLSGLNAQRDAQLSSTISKTERLDRLTAALGQFVGDTPIQLGEGKETVWDILHSLPRELLDPYQALTHLKVTSVFRNKNAPLIDYLTTKLAYLTALLDEARSQPLTSYNTASTAFVTFQDARTARLALKILDSHPKRSLACHTAPAPDWTDLLWNRLGKSTYRSEFVRGWVIFLAVWVFTLIWIFPVSLFCALTTLSNIGGFIPPLKAWLDANPKASSAISSLAPVFLVALLTIAICPILLAVANKAETIVTRLGIHNSVLERFWKFLMVNGVVFFAIGQTAIEAYLTAFQTRDFDPLPIVASSFPTAAPYFASYILLQTAIQPCFELFRFGLPAIVYVFGTRVSKTPRQRSGNTEYHFSQVPQQLLAGAIMHLFMLLNPLVIPFTLVYYGACYVVWKRQFTYVYGRLYENNGRRTSIRVLRYSLDALALGQFVLFAFFILNKKQGNAIATGILFSLTLIQKLIITRALTKRFDNLDVEEADILCPPIPREHDNSTRVDTSFDEDHYEGKERDEDEAHQARKNSKSKWERFEDFIGKWVYASSHRNLPAGYRKPIPFDHLLFARLDRWINFPLEPTRDEQQSGHAHMVVDPIRDSELLHSPDRPISHIPAPNIVTPHHPVRAWEDIPPYQRARGYADQPAYTDDYDDFLWLPRDPLSTIDLDDTVELRLALTTSAGGDGRFGNWPAEDEEENEDKEREDHITIQHEQGMPFAVDREEILAHPGSPDQHHDVETSPPPASERRLISPMLDESPTTSPLSTGFDLPPGIGSEVDENPASQLFRTIRIRQTVSRAFRRPRAETRSSGDAITLRTISRTSSTSQVAQPVTAPILPISIHDSPETEPTLAEVLQPPPVQPSHLSVSDNVPITAPPRGSQISFGLGRTASGRRPSRPVMPTEGSASSIHRNRSTLRSPSIRSAAVFSASGSSIGGGGGGRDRSASAISASQQALLREIMEEERQAAKESKMEEKLDQDKESEEMKKERERIEAGGSGDPTGNIIGSVSMRRGSNSQYAGSVGPGGAEFVRRGTGLGRSGSAVSNNNNNVGASNSTPVRRRVSRAQSAASRASGRSGTISATPTPQVSTPLLSGDDSRPTLPSSPPAPSPSQSPLPPLPPLPSISFGPNLGVVSAEIQNAIARDGSVSPLSLRQQTDPSPLQPSGDRQTDNQDKSHSL